MDGTGGRGHVVSILGYSWRLAVKDNVGRRTVVFKAYVSSLYYFFGVGRAVRLARFMQRYLQLLQDLKCDSMGPFAFEASILRRRAAPRPLSFFFGIVP